MKLFPDKKYNKIFMYCFSFTIITLLIITILFRWDVTRNIISNILNIFEPIILAAIIAFIMNPMMKSAQKFLSTKIFRKKPHPKLTRVLGIMFASIVIIAVIAAVILSVIPELISNIPGIYDGLVNDVIPQVQAWITKLLDDNPSIAAIVNNELESITSAIERLISGLVPQLTSLLASVLSFANSVKNFFFGFILAIYFLFSKEVLQAQAKKVIVALFSEKSIPQDIFHHIKHKSHLPQLYLRSDNRCFYCRMPLRDIHADI